MKRVLRIASVLTWFNLIFWGALVALCLLGGAVTGQTVLLVGVVLLSAVPLNCFASLKLHTSIRYPAIPLSHQTPVGIRFIGLAALFFGIYFIIIGLLNLADPVPTIETMKDMAKQAPEEMKAYFTAVGSKRAVMIIGVGLMVLGLLISVNVILNIRLLRWYLMVHRSDVS